MAINEKASKISKFLEALLVRTVFTGIVFVSLIISLHIMTESSIILPKYLPRLQIHLAGFQT